MIDGNTENTHGDDLMPATPVSLADLQAGERGFLEDADQCEDCDYSICIC